MKFPSFDKFLEKVTLNDDVDEDDYLDEDDSDVDLVDRHPSRRLIRRREETDSGSKSAVTSFPQQKRERRSFFGQAVEKPESAYESAPESARSPKVSTFRPRKAVQEDEETNNYSVCVIKPKSMEDALEIAKTLVARCVVILNLEGLDLDVSQRLFDFASGCTCALQGRLDKISNYIFVLTPKDIQITGEFQEILTGTFDPDDLGDDEDF